MIQFNCKNCNEPLESPESLAGNMLVCPQCKISQWVPGQPAKINEISPVQIAEPKKEDKPRNHRSDAALWVVLWIIGSIIFSLFGSGEGSVLGFALVFGCLMLLGIFISLCCLMAWSAKQANILERIAWQQSIKEASGPNNQKS
ncbi:MAG: hypothetical protein PHW13_14075 [Methylococcales bacterium]|nr:hypothetical protein [Methylococcales bacterium]